MQNDILATRTVCSVCVCLCLYDIFIIHLWNNGLSTWLLFVHSLIFTNYFCSDIHKNIHVFLLLSPILTFFIICFVKGIDSNYFSLSPDRNYPAGSNHWRFKITKTCSETMSCVLRCSTNTRVDLLFIWSVVDPELTFLCFCLVSSSQQISHQLYHSSSSSHPHATLLMLLLLLSLLHIYYVMLCYFKQHNVITMLCCAIFSNMTYHATVFLDVDHLSVTMYICVSDTILFESCTFWYLPLQLEPV